MTSGQRAEQLACEYLQREGLKLLDRNVHSRVGEIDLLMRDGDELVVIEVRSRRAGALVSAADSLSTQKQRRLIQATRQWLNRNPQFAEQPLRFDAVLLDGSKLNWVRDAFQAA